MFACELGYLKAVELLLEHNASIEINLWVTLILYSLNLTLLILD